MRSTIGTMLQFAFRKKIAMAKEDMAWKETIKRIAEEKKKRLEKIERLYEKTVHRLGIRKAPKTAL